MKAFVATLVWLLLGFTTLAQTTINAVKTEEYLKLDVHTPRRYVRTDSTRVRVSIWQTEIELRRDSTVLRRYYIERKQEFKSTHTRLVYYYCGEATLVYNPRQKSLAVMEPPRTFIYLSE